MSDDLVDVRLVELPVALHRRTAAHLNGLQRELDLIRIGGSDATGIPARLSAVIDELTVQYGGVGDKPRAELDAAAERGEQSIDLVYRIARSAGTASRRLTELLDEVDDHCSSRGHLLTLVTPPDLLAYRRWFLGEFQRQAGGEQPIPWPEHRPGTDHRIDATAAPSVHEPRSIPDGWTIETDGSTAVLAIAGPLDLVSAPALRDLLVETTSTATSTTIDLSGCDFIDSVGVSVLAAALLRAEDGGTELRFRLGEATRRVLEISGVLDRLTLVDEDR